MPENDVIQYFEDAEQDIYQYPKVAVRLKNRKLKKRKKNIPLYGDLTLAISNAENLILPRELLTLPLDNNVSDTEKLKNFKASLLVLIEKKLILGLSEEKLEKLINKINNLVPASPELSSQSKNIKSIKAIFEDEKVSIISAGTLEVVIGDLHGNFLKLIYTLLREGVIRGIDEKDYAFLATFLTKEYNKITQKEQKKYSQIINKIVIDPSSKIKLTLLGDVLRDRGPSDAFTLELISKLTTAPGHEKLEMDIIFSNHDLAFFNWYQTIESDEKFLQIKALEEQIKNAPKNQNFIKELKKLRDDFYRASFSTTMGKGQENSNKALCIQLANGLVSTIQLEKWVNVYFSKLKLFSHSETVDRNGNPIEKIKMHAQPNGLSVLKNAADWLLAGNSLNVETTLNRKALTQEVNVEFQRKISSSEKRKEFRDESVLDATRGYIQDMLNIYSLKGVKQKNKNSSLNQVEIWISRLKKKYANMFDELRKTIEYQQLQLLIGKEINSFIEITFQQYSCFQDPTEQDPILIKEKKEKEEAFLNAMDLLYRAINLMVPNPINDWNLKDKETIEYIGYNFFIMQEKFDLQEGEKLDEKDETKLKSFGDKYDDNPDVRAEQIRIFACLKKQKDESQSIQNMPSFSPCPVHALIYERELKNHELSTKDNKKIQWLHGHVGGNKKMLYSNDNVCFINVDSYFGNPDIDSKTDNLYPKEAYRIGYSYDLKEYDFIKNKSAYYLIDYKSNLENTLKNLANKLEKKADDIEIRNKIFFKDTKDDAITKARKLAESLRANVDTLKIIKPESLLGQTSIPALQGKAKEIDMIKEASLDLFVNVINDKNNPLMKARGFSWIIKKGAEILEKIGNSFTSSSSTLINSDSNELASTKVCPKSVFFPTKSVKKIQNALEEINTFESILPTPRNSGIK